MSQDDRNSQTPFTPKPRANQSEPTAEQITQPPPKPYQRVQPFWKAKSIQILRGTIDLLETVLVKLKTAPPFSTQQTRSFVQQIQSWWTTLLVKIRSFLPTRLSAKLSDTALTGLVLGLLIVSLWTISSIFTGKSSEVANVPPQQLPESPVKITTPAETLPSEAIATPEVQPPLAKETAPPTPEVQPLEPEQTHSLVLTPEQTLIAAVENQVAEVSNRFASGLIRSIQADFKSSSLSVKVSDDWFNLEPSQQDKLAADMLERSRSLDFSHLYVIDSQDKLVARNPVVGTEMVILRRGVT